MEVWECIEILKKSDDNWFFGGKRRDEKILALNKLSEVGYPSIIYNLIPLLQNNSKEIRKATIQTIKYLFKKLDSKKAYYGALKNCYISKVDIGYYNQNFNKSDFIFLIKTSN